LLFLAVLWLRLCVPSAGEDMRVPRDDLRGSTATLVVANAAFVIWGGFVALDGDLAARGRLLTVVAPLAHLAIGGWMLRRQGLEHLFANLVTGTGLALLALAAL